MKRRLDGVPGWLALNAPLVLAAIGLLAGCTTFASQHENAPTRCCSRPSAARRAAR